MTAETKTQSASQFPSTLEIATKVIAASAVVLYVIGYLVISIHHSRYGVIQVDPFKSRIVSAGGWFVVMTFIPVFACLEGMEWERQPWNRVFLRAFPYWMFCCTLTLFAAILFANENLMLKPNWSEISGLVGIGAILACLTLTKTKESWVALASVMATLVFVIWSIRNLAKAGTFTFSAVVLWFFSVGFLTVLELMNRSEPRLRDVRWIRSFFGILLLIFVFARFYFPHIKASWGGGGQVLVRVHTTKDSTIRPDADIYGQLIDEEDAGLYLMPDHSNQAIFLPRVMIALISFSEPDSRGESR